jgi:DNA-binding transcriptional MerR regulator
VAGKEKEKKYLTIGKTVKRLKKLYPGLTGSKLRFLESEGLISPKRASNRYRIYSEEDIERLNFILKMQKDFYLPLPVIKQKIKTSEFKDFISTSKSSESLESKLDEELKPDYSTRKFTQEDIRKNFKLSQSSMNELLENEIISWSKEDHKYIVNAEDIEILKIAGELAKYGIKVKHLKLFENFASRNSSFMQQIIFPLLMSGKKGFHNRAARELSRLERMLCDFQELLIKRENRRFIEKYK